MSQNQRTQYAIGIDVGTKTGLAIYDRSKRTLVEVKTLKIHKALELVRLWHKEHQITVVVEDARQVKYKTDPVKAQGAGSVKRDSTIWADFLTDENIAHTMKRPSKALSKLNEEIFRKITRYEGKTSQHGRDASMLVFGLY